MRRRALALLEILAVGLVLGVAFGLLWWFVTPAQEWLVTPDGARPVDVWSSAWFAADGWFLVLGALAGVLLTLTVWRRHRDEPLLLVGSLVAGSALLALTAQMIGEALGPAAPETRVPTAADGGEVVEGALQVVATGVLFAPTVAALTLLVLLLASAAPDEATPPDADADPNGAPPQPDVATS